MRKVSCALSLHSKPAYLRTPIMMSHVQSTRGRAIPSSTIAAVIIRIVLTVAFVGQAGAREQPPAALEGTARIVDGDTLNLSGTRIRLASMDAPEREQLCRDENASTYRCGDAAADALGRLIAGARVTCRAEGTDRYRRTLAICGTVRQPDLGLAMIREGWATVYDGGPVSAEYRAAEESARRRKVGLWRGSFERPSAWRRQRRSGAEIPEFSAQFLCAFEGIDHQQDRPGDDRSRLEAR